MSKGKRNLQVIAGFSDEATETLNKSLLEQMLDNQIENNDMQCQMLKELKGIHIQLQMMNDFEEP